MEYIYIILVYMHRKEYNFQLLQCTPIYTSLYCSNYIVIEGTDNVKYKTFIYQ